METAVTINYRELVELALNGNLGAVAEAINACSGEVSYLLRGLLLFESDPETGKDLFSNAARSADSDLANQAAIYEARCYEYTSQWEEGRILIRDVLRRDLKPYLRGHALYALACLQIATPKRALSTLDEIDLGPLCSGLKGRVYTIRGRMQTRLRQYDAALIEYAGAAHYFEEAGHVSGVAHAHNNRASVYRKQKNYSGAHESVDTAIVLVSKSDPFLPEFLDQKARIFIDEKKFDAASTLAERAIRIVEGSGKDHVLSECLCALGIALVGLKDYPAAGAAFARAKNIADSLNSTDLLFEVAKTLRTAAQMVLTDSEVTMAELALKLCDGSYRAAAEKIGLTHPGIIKLLARNSRQWKPKRPQGVIPKPRK